MVQAIDRTRESAQRSHISPRKARSLTIPREEITLAACVELTRLGIGFDAKVVDRMISGMTEAGIAMDATPQATVTTASITTPMQFLQNWLPGFVKVVTAARKIDELVGITTSGSWEDEQVVQGILELTGTSVPYGDYTNVPFSSWNANYEYRTVVRFEEGMRVGKLEEARAARANIDSASGKRESAALALEINRNLIGFYGYNNGAGKTYGFLNDPGLGAYVSAPTGNWNTATFLQITGDIRAALQALRTQSNDTIDPQQIEITLALPTNRVEYLTVTSDYGISVRDWINQNYPKLRVVSAPQLNGANGGANVFYLYAEKFEDTSTDNGRVMDQIVPAKFQVLGVSQQAKFYEEDYANATAGVFVKRPFAVVRYTGI